MSVIFRIKREMSVLSLSVMAELFQDSMCVIVCVGDHSVCLWYWGSKGRWLYCHLV